MTQRSREVLLDHLKDGEFVAALKEAANFRRLRVEAHMLGASPSTGDEAMRMWGLLEGARRELMELETDPLHYLGIKSSR